MLVVVNRKSASHGVITRGRTFGLNFLGEHQASLASYFAGGDAKTFGAAPHSVGTTGCPLLEGCAAQLECVVESMYDQGTHTIIVGRAVEAAAGVAPPLAYCDAAQGLCDQRVFSARRAETGARRRWALVRPGGLEAAAIIERADADLTNERAAHDVDIPEAAGVGNALEG